jgi:hypothetical protein
VAITASQLTEVSVQPCTAPALLPVGGERLVIVIELLYGQKQQ